MGSTVGIYFDLNQEQTNALRDRLNRLAARLGYTARRGPTYGEGNLAALLQGIDSGDCEVVRRRYWCDTADETFDAVIGWASIYPPADAASAAALAAVPERWRAAFAAAYGSAGVDLRCVAPGDRWMVELADDWSAAFGSALIAAGIDRDEWRESGELRDAAYNFALDIATATDQALVALLGDDGTAGQGTVWGIEEESGRAWYAAR